MSYPDGKGYMMDIPHAIEAAIRADERARIEGVLVWECPLCKTHFPGIDWPHSACVEEVGQ